MNKDIRWQQRFNNFKKALKTIESAVALADQRDLTDLEKQGLIQGFEFTHELFWNTVKDFIEERGNQNIFGSKDATRQAFEYGLISNGEEWMNMINSRNLSSHTYQEQIASEIVKDIIQVYFDLFKGFEGKMEEFIALKGSSEDSSI